MVTERVTDRLAALVESCGMEIAVTLLVQGTPVTGLLTSVLREAEFLRQRFAIWQLAGSGIQDTTTEPASPQEIESIRESWERNFPGEGAGDLSLPTLCLRDAVIRVGPISSWTHCMYLLIDADKVSAIALGFSVVPTPTEED
jgi:hypothetical protein